MKDVFFPSAYQFLIEIIKFLFYEFLEDSFKVNIWLIVNEHTGGIIAVLPIFLVCFLSSAYWISLAHLDR
jgi:hypothetical protein